MLWQCSPSLPEGHQVLVRVQEHKSWETRSCWLTFGEKILSAKGVSYPGSSPTARHWLRD